MVNWQKLSIYCCLLAVLAGCSSGVSQPYTSPPGRAGEQLVAISKGLIGAPYLYGGQSPAGFDCSGLVNYVYAEIGISVPRSSRLLYRHARKVNLRSLQPGDLVFFNISRNKVSHVGIYAANGKFIHAPSSGKRVSLARLDNPYWQKRLIGAGRFH